MKRLLLIGRASAIAVLVSCFAVGYAAASHPDILRNYRFIPSRSTLEVTGGFAGLEQTFHAYGTFGLVTGYDEGVTCMAIGCPPPPTHIPYAEFFDVRAWLVPDSPLAFVWDLDDTLNLTGLRGTFQHPNRLFFSGTDGQGQPFRLQATIHDRLIRLVGENDPGCCDFFHYKFSALAYLTPHPDFNLDGVVDTADYVAWRRTLAETGAGSDADNNSAIGFFDYDLWRSHFGETIDFSVFDTPETSSAAAPEPGTLALIIAGGVMLEGLRNRRRR